MPKEWFMQNQELARLPVPKRLNTFVISPGWPTMDIDGKEYIELGEATIDLLKHTGIAGLCPRVIFLDNPKDKIIGVVEDAYKPHRLSTYAAQIGQEKQLPLNIHIAAHTDPDTIGSITLESRVKIDAFAEAFNAWFCTHMGEAPAAALKRGRIIGSKIERPIHFIFHTCNSAWAPTQLGMPTEIIAAHILNHSLIGKFKRQMTKLGFMNITVTGFRGFYAHGSSHKASFVSEYPADGRSVSAEKTKFVIAADNHVLIPSTPHFPVSLVDARPLSHLAGSTRLEFFDKRSIKKEPSSTDPKLTPHVYIMP